MEQQGEGDQQGGGAIIWKVISILIMIGLFILGIKFFLDQRKKAEEENEEVVTEQETNDED